MYNFNPVFPFPDGYFPDFYKEIFKQDSILKSVYPNIGFETDWQKLILSRETFSLDKRKILSNALANQYGDLAKGKVKSNIQLLQQNNTFTVTTGQQIHIFLGPMYLVYKAISTIQLARELGILFKDKNFVPVFWIATEDHDFEEINHLNFLGKELRWSSDQGGAVGRFSCKNLSRIIDDLEVQFQQNEAFITELQIFKTAYTKYSSLADATRYLLNHFFNKDGLVIIDPDDQNLKGLFKSGMQEDLIFKSTKDAMDLATTELKKIKISASIQSKNGNFFLLEPNQRRRIDIDENGYKIGDGNTMLKAEEIQKIINQAPEKLSPNVALRPVYQETILPNIAYIAGPGEFKYWLQLGAVFQKHSLDPPALIPRHSIVFTTQKFEAWFGKSGFDLDQFWQSTPKILEAAEKIWFQSTLDKEFDQLKDALAAVFKGLYEQHNPQLKEIKRLGDDFIKQVQTANNAHKSNLGKSTEMESRREKLIKMHAAFFDTDAPQERSMSFLESLLIDSQLLLKIEQANLGFSTCLYTARYA